MPTSEASCSSQILTAQAVAHDMGETVAVSSGVDRWARCGTNNSERDVHRVLKHQRTKLDIRVDTMPCGGCDVPWINPESWVKFLVKNGLWPTLAGCKRSDYQSSLDNWTSFWKAYEKINPTFELFRIPDVDFSRCAGVLIHGDEGRTLKRNGLMVTSLQSILGQGYDCKRVGVQGDTNNLKVNFAGHSFTTRFVVSTIPKTSYENNPEVFHDAMQHMAKSLNNLFWKGFVDDTRGGETFRLVILGAKGDAPYLQKLGNLYRSYNTTAKRGEERGPPKGVCPYCLAGTRNFPCEEIATSSPRWLTTVGVKLPWVKTPSVIKHCLHDRADPATFFKTDIWHVFHLGFGRSWIASVVQVSLPYIPCGNLEQKFEFLTDHYLNWCKHNRKQAHVSKISQYLMSYGDASGAMGNWHKGGLTTNFMQWIIDFLGAIPSDPQGLLTRSRQVTYRVNAMFSTLYKSGAFLNETECEFVSQQGLHFLQCYAQNATAMFRCGKQYLFPLYPKLHLFHHIMLDLKMQGAELKIALNPLCFGCQMDEDVVGKASRLSRRVNIRRVASRALDRYLVAAYAAYTKAKLLV